MLLFRDAVVVRAIRCKKKLGQKLFLQMLFGAKVVWCKNWFV